MSHSALFITTNLSKHNNYYYLYYNSTKYTRMLDVGWRKCFAPRNYSTLHSSWKERVVVCCKKTPWQVTHWSKKYAFILLGIGVAGIVLLVGKHSAWLYKNTGFQWIESLELPVRFLVFFFLHTIAVIGCFPGTVALEVAAGLSMHMGLAFICMYFSKLLAAMISFLLARTILYEWTRKRLEKFPQTWISGIAKQGWRWVLFARLSPVPSFVNNYLIALSPISFREYIAATAVGIIPFLLQVVVLGAGIQDVKRNHVSWTVVLRYLPILVGIVAWSWKQKMGGKDDAA